MNIEIDTNYTPDHWQIVKVKGVRGLHKLFSGWDGSYLYGASWRLNSGINYIEEDGDYYKVYGYSGSIYHCHKLRGQLSGYALSVCNSYSDKLKPISITSILKRYKDKPNANTN